MHMKDAERLRALEMASISLMICSLCLLTAGLLSLSSLKPRDCTTGCWQDEEKHLGTQLSPFGTLIRNADCAFSRVLWADGEIRHGFLRETLSLRS